MRRESLEQYKELGRWKRGDSFNNTTTTTTFSIETFRTKSSDLLFVIFLVLVPFLFFLFISFLPFIFSFLCIFFFASIFAITPLVIAGIFILLLNILKKRIQNHENIMKIIDVWLLFLFPFHSLLVLLFIGFFSFTWSIGIGFILWIFPRQPNKFSKFFFQFFKNTKKKKKTLLITTTTKKEENIGDHRWEYLIELCSKIFSPVFDYFPISIHEITTTTHHHRTLYCYHPHGIYAFGLFSLIFGKISGQRKNLLVGVASSLLAIPGLGHICSWFGFIPASRESFEKVILNSEVDLALVPGGIAEMLLFDENDNDSKTNKDNSNNIEYVYLKNRKGFIRLALKYKLNIVPIYGFGENRTFKRYTYGKVIRERISRTFRVVIQLFHGRFYTLIPYQVPLNVVYGESLQFPIQLQYGEDPTQEQVDDAHKLYCEALYHLFEHYKHQFGYEHSILKFV